MFLFLILKYLNIKKALNKIKIKSFIKKNL